MQLPQSEDYDSEDQVFIMWTWCLHTIIMFVCCANSELCLCVSSIPGKVWWNTYDLQCGKRNKVLLVYIDVTYLTIEVAYIYMVNVVLVYTPDRRIVIFCICIQVVKGATPLHPGRLVGSGSCKVWCIQFTVCYYHIGRYTRLHVHTVPDEIVNIFYHIVKLSSDVQCGDTPKVQPNT